MAGLFGFIAATPRTDGEAFLTRIFGPALRAPVHERLVDPEGRWAIGRSHLGTLQRQPQLSASHSVHVLLHGDLHRAGDRRAGEAPGAEGGDVRTLACLYQTRGDAFAGMIDGAFCAAILDAPRRRLLLLSDAIGSYPLYWTATDEGLVFGSELSAVLRHPAVRPRINPGAVADYVSFGMPLGTKTLAAGVQLLPAGSLLTWEPGTGAVAVQKVADIAAAFRPWEGTRATYVDALCDTFHRAVERSVSGDHALGLSLSGGLDSRAILAALNGRGGTISTYTLGVKGCADEVIAARLARLAGTRHTCFQLDDRYLRDFLPNLRRMVSLTDGMYLSHGLTEMLALSFLESAPFRVLVRGHGGELAKTDLAWPLHTDDHVRTLDSAPALVSYLLERTNYISPGIELDAVFAPAFARQMAGAARRSLEEAVAGVDLPPADLCSYLYLTQHHRRCTVASLELFRHAVDVRLPFADREFLEVLFRGDHSWRADTGIHRALTRSGHAALLRVRNSNTGAPADAGPVAERLLDKVNSLFRRMNLPGYRHYHNFQAWMEAQLLSSVETVLLSPTSLDRGILSEKGIRRLLDDTRLGRGDHSYLLQVLLILELWQQENL